MSRSGADRAAAITAATGTPITWNIEKRGQSVEKIRRVAGDRDAFIVPGHDETGVEQTNGEVQFNAIKYLPEHVYE